MRHTGKDEVSPLTGVEDSQMNIPWVCAKTTHALFHSLGLNCRDRVLWRCKYASGKAPKAPSQSQALREVSRLRAADLVLEPFGPNARRNTVSIVAAATTATVGEPTAVPLLCRSAPATGAMLLGGHRHRHPRVKPGPLLYHGHDPYYACKSTLRPRSANKVSSRANDFKQTQFLFTSVQSERRT